jgi:hypothetical protein
MYGSKLLSMHDAQVVLQLHRLLIAKAHVCSIVVYTISHHCNAGVTPEAWFLFLEKACAMHCAPDLDDVWAQYQASKSGDKAVALQWIAGK